MHIFKIALLVLGLATAALPASGKTVPESGKEQSYQLFNKKYIQRGRRAHDGVGTGRVISQDLINRLSALKNPSASTTHIITTTTTPTYTTITISPTTITPTTTSPTTTSPTTTTTTNSTSRNFVDLANFDDEDAFENDEDDSPVVLQQHNRSIDKYDDEEDVDVDADIADTAVEFGRAARARPSNWRRRLQRQRQRQRRLRRQAMRRRQRRQRLRRQQLRRNQQRRRKASKNSIRRRNGKRGGNNRNKRRRTVRVKA